jgi:hypothetical protein
MSESSASGPLKLDFAVNVLKRIMFNFKALQCSVHLRIEAKHLLLVFLHYTKPKLEFITVRIQAQTFCFGVKFCTVVNIWKFFVAKFKYYLRNQNSFFFPPKKMFKIASFLQIVQVGSQKYI